MDKVSPKSPRVAPLQSEGVDERKKANPSPSPHRGVSAPKPPESPGVAAQFEKDELQVPIKPRVEAKKVTAGKLLKPGEARSLDTLREQATAPLPKSLSVLPPYRHIWISHQFDELYTPVYKDLEAQAKSKHEVIVAKLGANNMFTPQSFRANLHCVRLGRHLIFNGFSLARDFIMSEAIIAKGAFRDRESLAIEVLEKLYAFTLAKVEAGTFSLKDFVHVNLLLALLVDWRKGAITELEVILREVHPVMKNAVEEKKPDNTFLLREMFENLAKRDFLQVGVNSSLLMPIREDLFLINEFMLGELLKTLNDQQLHNMKMLFEVKNSSVLQDIQLDLYQQLPLKTLPFFGYTDKQSGISEERYVKAFFDCPEALITVFNPHAGHFEEKDLDHPSARFTKKVVSEAYAYQPHQNKLTTLTEIDHDYRHMKLRDNFMADFMKAFGFSFEEVMKPVNALLRVESLSTLEKQTLTKLNFFLIHEVSTLLFIRYEKFILGKKQPMFYLGWSEFFTHIGNQKKHSPKEALKWIVDKCKEALTNNYIHMVGTEPYRSLYRDMELMLHESVEFCPKDSSEKQFTHKPLRGKEGHLLLPSFQELYEGAFDAFEKASAIKKEDKLVIFKQIERATNLYQKWKALPKSIRNEAKANALALGYERFFDMAWEIIDRCIPDEKPLNQGVVTRYKNSKNKQ